MPTNIKKNMAPKPKAKSDVYKKLPYKDAPKPKLIEQDDKNFKLGSNRGNDTYSALKAKGLISPIYIEDKKDEAEKQYEKNVSEGRTNPDKGASNRDVANLATVSQREMDIGKVRAGLSEKAKADAKAKKQAQLKADIKEAKKKAYLAAQNKK